MLPDDILNEIIFYLDISCIPNFACSNTKFNTLCSNEYLWKKRFICEVLKYSSEYFNLTGFEDLDLSVSDFSDCIAKYRKYKNSFIVPIRVITQEVGFIRIFPKEDTNKTICTKIYNALFRMKYVNKIKENSDYSFVAYHCTLKRAVLIRNDDLEPNKLDENGIIILLNPEEFNAVNVTYTIIESINTMISTYTVS